jgi:hypothetical protein
MTIRPRQTLLRDAGAGAAHPSSAIGNGSVIWLSFAAGLDAIDERSASNSALVASVVSQTKMRMGEGEPAWF